MGIEAMAFTLFHFALLCFCRETAHWVTGTASSLAPGICKAFSLGELWGTGPNED